MKHIHEGKTVNIPDDYIERNMKALDITKDEAIEMYLSDEGYIVDETVVELSAKAKAAGPIKHDVTMKAKRKAPERKPDMAKRSLIAAFASAIEMSQLDEDFNIFGEVLPTSFTISNIERMIAFTVGDDNYELTLTKKRKPKKG